MSALFCDSWEIKSDYIWDPQLDAKFIEIFGYDLRKHLMDLDECLDTSGYAETIAYKKGRTEGKGGKEVLMSCYLGTTTGR